MRGPNEADRRARLYAELEAASTEADFLDFLERLALAFAFTAYWIVAIPASSQDALEATIIASNWPPEFLKSYDALRLLRNSPVFAKVRTSTAPITWDISELEAGRPRSEVAEARDLLLRYNLTSGILFSVHGADGNRAVMGFEGARGPLEGWEYDELGMFAVHVYDAFDRIRREPKSEFAKLSDREVEVLSWAANGKTSVEIATILSLSDHTVNSYLNTAMRKLDCVNRTQLVAKALRLRIIS